MIKWNQKFNLTLLTKLPENGFSLDELVYKTKEMFEEDGQTGFLTVLLGLLDQIVYPSEARKNKARKCCSESYYVVSGREFKRIMTSIGELYIPWTRLKCKGCGKSFIPLREHLGVEPHQPKSSELEKIVMEVVSEQSYRRSSQHIESIGCLPVPHTRLHRWVAQSNCDEMNQTKRVQTLVADGTGFKKKLDFEGSNRGEVRVVVGVTKEGKVTPYGAWCEESWKDIGKEIKNSNPTNKKIKYKPIADMLVSDGEEGIIRAFKSVTKDQQRCTWHLTRELYGPLRINDGAPLRETRILQSELAGIIDIKLPEKDFKKVKLEEKLKLEVETFKAEKALDDYSSSLFEKGYDQAAKYILNAKKNIFSYIKMWLKTGLANPRVSSMIERMMREIGRRIKKIGFGWKPENAAKMTRIIIKRITSANEWEKYWKKKLNFSGEVEVQFLGCNLK